MWIECNVTLKERNSQMGGGRLGHQPFIWPFFQRTNFFSVPELPIPNPPLQVLLVLLTIRVVLTVRTIKRQAPNNMNTMQFHIIHIHRGCACNSLSTYTCLPFSAFAIQLLLSFSNVVLEYRSCKNDEGRTLAVTLCCMQQSHKSYYLLITKEKLYWKLMYWEVTD